MPAKILHEDLHLGSKGEKRSLRLYGTSGLHQEAYVQLESPHGDFPAVIYRLPAMPAMGGMLTLGADNFMEWALGTLKATAVYQVGRLDTDLPAGHAITGIIASNNTPQSGQITFGSTPTGSDIYPSFPVDAQGVLKGNDYN
jgi:hypothetical protein